MAALALRKQPDVHLPLYELRGFGHGGGEDDPATIGGVFALDELDFGGVTMNHLLFAHLVRFLHTVHR